MILRFYLFSQWTKWSPFRECIFANDKFCILVKISLKLLPKGPVDNNLVMVVVMACRRIDDKPLPEPMMLCPVITSQRMEECGTLGCPEIEVIVKNIITCHPPQLGYICPASSNLICNEGERMSPYSQCQTLAPFMGNSSEGNITSFNYVCRFIVNRFYFGIIFYEDIKDVTSAASLDNGHCEATIPVA